MKIRALCVMKNESDVIVQSLTHALEWCDEIFVLDNGSNDGGWEKVQALSHLEPQIKLAGQDVRAFHDGIRAQIFNAYNANARRGDWWCRLDADEFYIDNPRELLSSIPEKYFSVWSASISYYFTEVDAAIYYLNPEQYGDDISVHNKCRYYLNHWSEPRFFRHIPGLRWKPSDGGYPRTLWSYPPAPTRIRLKHFAYRSPQQIQKRLDSRREQASHGNEFSHETILDWGQAVANIRARGKFEGTEGGLVPTSWKERIVPSSALDFDSGDGLLVLNEALMPRLPDAWSKSQQFRAWAQSARRNWLRPESGS